MVNPGDLIASVARTFEPAFSRRRMVLRVAGQEVPQCRLEPDGFIQILANLLSNAEKYAACGDVDILFFRADSELVVQVRDHGPGVDEAEAQRIFEPFVRLSDRLTEGVAGAGLGLGIARDAAERLGGKLSLVPASVTGGTNGGAVFELRLPVYASADGIASEADSVLQSEPQALDRTYNASMT
jgi:signal transduction histidine kinase